MAPRAFVLALIVLTPVAAATADVVRQIDEAIISVWESKQITPAKRASGPQLVRRLFLDLAGRIPATDELTSWTPVAETDVAQLVDHLLASEDYVQHFTDTFDSLLMGRGNPRQYDQRHQHQWRVWLERVFRENRPWNLVVADILRARPDAPEQRGAIWYLYERNNEHQKMAEAIAPAFFGIRIECAQCHDHMVAPEIEQAHYWGLVAFFNRSSNADTPAGPRLAESAVGGFSEFADLSGDSSPNLLTFFQSDTVPETRPAADEKQSDDDNLYLQASLESDPKVPVFSRREQFVRQIVEGHPLLARAFVNRIWALLVGRGLVHPHDEMDSAHPPSHPRLLDSLAEAFRESDYNIRQLVRNVVLSAPYRLDARRPDGVDDPAAFAWRLETPLTAEQFSRSVQIALRGTIDNDVQRHSLTAAARPHLAPALPADNSTSVSTALFLTNHMALNRFINDSTKPGHLIPSLLQLDSDEQRIDVLFQTLYARPPAADETQRLTAYLSDAADRSEQRLQQVIWSMLTSAEFTLNH